MQTANDSRDQKARQKMPDASVSPQPFKDCFWHSGNQGISNKKFYSALRLGQESTRLPRDKLVTVVLVVVANHLNQKTV